MTRGLIGYTGFVGSNLQQQRGFDELYNSKNFREMSKKSFSELVCSGIYAEKWRANKEPAQDSASIQELINILKTVHTDRFVLISTIDVYPVIQGKDENYDCHQKTNHAYGTNRLLFEDFCTQHFPNCYVVRLPGLFGRGLKKNIIFDLLNNNMLESINPSSTLQYYYLNNLWSDIEKAILSEISLINLFTEPIATYEIVKRFFPQKSIGNDAVQECHYDLQTCHSHIYGKNGPYRHSKEEVMIQMQEFVDYEISNLQYSMG